MGSTILSPLRGADEVEGDIDGIRYQVKPWSRSVRCPIGLSELGDLIKICGGELDLCSLPSQDREGRVGVRGGKATELQSVSSGRVFPLWLQRFHKSLMVYRAKAREVTASSPQNQYPTDKEKGTGHLSRPPTSQNSFNENIAKETLLTTHSFIHTYLLCQELYSNKQNKHPAIGNYAPRCATRYSLQTYNRSQTPELFPSQAMRSD